MTKVIEQLNQIQADANLFYIQLHNYHWNVKGTQFFAIHKYTEEAYDEMGEIFDEVAERALQIGGKAIVCPKTMLEMSKLQPQKADSFTTKEVCEALVKSYEYFIDAFKKLRQEADKVDDFGTVALAEDKVACFQKRIWMLKATLA